MGAGAAGPQTRALKAESGTTRPEPPASETWGELRASVECACAAAAAAGQRPSLGPRRVRDGDWREGYPGTRVRGQARPAGTTASARWELMRLGRRSLKLWQPEVGKGAGLFGKPRAELTPRGGRWRS